MPMRASYHTTDLDGESRINPGLADMRCVLESLQDADEADFPDVSLVHSSGWAVTVNDRWAAVLEKVPDDGTPPAVLAAGSLDAALELWRLLAAGEIDVLLARPWVRQGRPDR